MENILLKSSLFKGISQMELIEILNRFPYKVRTFGANDFVAMQYDKCENLMIVTEGLIQAQMVDSTGKLIVVEELGAGEVLAPAFLFSSGNRMPVSVVAMQHTGIFYLKRAVLVEIMQACQQVLINYLQLISDRAVFLSQRLNFHAFKTLKNKIAFYLFDIYQREKSLHICFEYTQQNLSERFGVTRPALARAIGEMNKEGIIQSKGKDVKIVDLQKLKMLV